MKKSLLIVLAVFVLVSTASQAAAQQSPPPGPPKILSMFREDIKAGRGAAHENVETGYVRAMQRAKYPVYYLAMTAAFGGTDAWFVTAYDSFAALQKDRDNQNKNAQLTADTERMDALDAEFRTGQRSIVCVLNEELSYGKPVDVSQMRFFSITTVRVRPGHDAEYREARKILVDALKKANSDANTSFYSVSAGMPGGTYMIFTPRKSLAELDPNPAMGRAIQEAMGEDNNKKRLKAISDSVAGTDVSIYAISAKMSYVPKEWAKTGGEFWAPKPSPRPVVAKKPAAAEKPAEKKGQ
jgi:hypothetical protein